MPLDITACTIDSGARLSAPTCSSQATTTIQPSANHRERNRPAALPSVVPHPDRRRNHRPPVLEQEGDVGGQRRDECEKSPRIMSRAAEPQLTAAATAVPWLGAFQVPLPLTTARVDRRHARRTGRASAAPTASEHGDPDVCTSPTSRSVTPPAICVAARTATIKPSNGTEDPQRRDAAVEPAGGRVEPHAMAARAERCGASGAGRRRARGVHRRCDRACVSRAFAASQIRPSSRSRVGLVGLEL
jgi:hypothetical protein